MRQRPNLRKNAPGRRPPEGGAEQPQQFAGLLVRAGGGHDGDVHAANLLHLVVVDLGKDQLLLHADVQVAAAIAVCRGSAPASPTRMFTTAFSTRGTCITFR